MTVNTVCELAACAFGALNPFKEVGGREDHLVNSTESVAPDVFRGRVRWPFQLHGRCEGKMYLSETRLEASSSPVLLQQYVAGQSACGVDPSLDVDRHNARPYEAETDEVAAIIGRQWFVPMSHQGQLPAVRCTFGCMSSMFKLFAGACSWTSQ
jgi:hypothetical protein